MSYLTRSFYKVFFLVTSVIIVSACKKDKVPETNTSSNPSGHISVSGKVQKGPYKNGSAIIAYELNSSLGQTGKSFSAVINDNAGNFALNNINLSTQYILITASGYYYNEHFDRQSEGQLYLEALADVSNSSTININVLTHIIKPRIEALVAQGASFNAARSQAQSEFAQVVGATGINSLSFETMDVTNGPFLMAMSLLFQRHSSGYQLGYNYTAELSGLLSNFRNDFANNGAIDSHSIIDTLVHNAVRIDLIDAKANLQNYYSSLGLTTSAPAFEEYIYQFQKKYCAPLYTNISFPDTALVMTDTPPYSQLKNILCKSSTNFSTSGMKIMSANVPCDSALTIIFTKLGSGGVISIAGPYFGWKISNQTFTGFTLTAQRKNIPLCTLLMLQGQDSARVDYFQNNASLPYFSKIISW